MNAEQARRIPIDACLARQGISPKRSRLDGRELWYQSPIRQGDENPSFKVDTIKNVWFDHGVASGGNIIDLVRELCACDVRDALQHLEKTGLYFPALSRPSTSSAAARGALRRDEATPGTAGEKEKSRAFELVSQGPLKHPALLQYLTKRGICHDIARGYLSEIAFKAPYSAATYFSLGYPAGDGYEARSALFKGFVGNGKAVTFHDKPGASLLQVFEGFMDFLSYLSKDQPSQSGRCSCSTRRTSGGGRCHTLPIPVSKRCACTWTTMRPATPRPANFLRTLLTPANLRICASTMPGSRI